MWPAFFTSNVTGPGFKDVDESTILNSDSVTWTVCDAGLAVVVVAAAVVAAALVVGAVVVCCVVGAAAVSVLCSFGSAPKTSTAVSIPMKKTTTTMMNAGSPRPGKSGLKRGS